MVVIGKELLYSGKVFVFGQKWLFSDKSGCIRSNVAVFGQKWLYSGKVPLFGQRGCIRVKVVVIGQKFFYSGKSGCI